MLFASALSFFTLAICDAAPPAGNNNNNQNYQQQDPSQYNQNNAQPTQTYYNAPGYSGPFNNTPANYDAFPGDREENNIYQSNKLHPPQ